MISILLGLIFPLCAYSADQNFIQVWNFDQGFTTDQKGYFNRFENSDSTARTFLTDQIYYGIGGRSWEITVTKAAAGFCGAWIHFFETKTLPEDRTYLNASNHFYLFFRIRGKEGGEKVRVQMADKSWVLKEDSIPCSPLKNYLPKEITTNWQEVTIPLKDFEGINTAELGGLTFSFVEQGSYTVYIDDIYIAKNKEVSIPQTKTENKPFTKIPRKKAMWVWESHRLLADEEAREEFFRFCKTYGVNDIFFQLQYKFDKSNPRDVKTELLMVDESRAFIKEAHEKNIVIQALEGYPEWVLKKWHSHPLSLIQAVIDYNQAVTSQERFDGIHFDNEPHLLMGFNDRVYRKTILREFIELNVEATKLVHAQSDMVYGIDIPFWFEERGDSGNIEGLCKWQGVEKPASYHLLDVVDNIGSMNYRDRCFGADGILAHGIQEIEYADKIGKLVYMGVETFRYPLIKVDMVCGMKKDLFFKRLNTDLMELRDLSRMDGPRFRLQFLEADDYVHVGLERPANMDKERSKRYDKALLKLARWVGTPPEGFINLDDVLFDTEYALSKNLSWDSLTPSHISSLDRKETYASFKTTLVMQPKITFDGQTKAQMDRELFSVNKEFLSHSSFLGFAIHYYKTYKGMPD